VRRSQVYTDPVVDGRTLRERPAARLGRSLSGLLVSRGEREEAQMGAAITATATLTRANTIAVVSPKGGVGKTTCTFVLGNLLASHLKLRVLAVDANRDFGTLALLTPDHLRVEKTIPDLLAEMARVHSASELRPYVSALPSGLHLLAAPAHAEVMAQMTPGVYGELHALLSCYYDVIVLDLGTGIIDPLAQFGLSRADHKLLIATPEYVTAAKVIDSLRHIGAEAADRDRAAEVTMVLNRVPAGRSGGAGEIEQAFRGIGVGGHVVVPYDEQLRVMLDSATYSLEALPRGTRMAIKALGLAAAGRLV